MNVIACLVNLKTRILYVPSGPSMGDRGPNFILRALLMFLSIPYGEYFVFRFRKKINPGNLFGLMFFPVLPVIGAVLQVLYPNISTTTNTGEVISMLNLYLFVQEKIAATDPLTGVGNRRSLDSGLEERISSGKRFSGIMVDMDRFKDINDTYGHAQGDVALQQVSALLQKQCRKTELVYRFGGDEFCMILDSGEEHTPAQYMARVSEAVDELNRSGVLPFRVGLSMGAAVYDADTMDGAKAFFTQMDDMLYQEKERRHQLGLR